MRPAKFPLLQELNLRLNNLGNEGCEHLESSNWVNLQDLNLERNNIKSEKHFLSFNCYANQWQASQAIFSILLRLTLKF